MTLRSRLIAMCGLIALTLLFVVVLVPRAVESAQIRQIDQQLRGAIPLALDRSRFPQLAVPDGTPRPLSLNDLYVADVGDDGARIEVITSREAQAAAPVLPPGNAIGGPLRFVTVGSLNKGAATWRAGLLPVRGSTRSVLVAIPLARVDATTTNVRWSLMAGAGAVLAALLLGAWWIIRLGLRPIAEVTEVADAIAAGDRDRRAGDTSSGTEASHLARAMNTMLNQRNEAEDRLRQFVADASHELRTPVSSVRGFTDLYRGGALAGPGELDDAMRRMGQEARRMEGLVNDLLLLARIDQGRPLETGPVDVDAIFADARLDAHATHPSRSIVVLAQPGIIVRGDDARLRQVVANLVNNALTHGGPLAEVKISSRVVDSTCVIEVADDGVGMEPADAARAFDRFWRADPSRQRNGGGSGLGLSIVKAIVEAHGGQILMETEPNAGTLLRVLLPV